MTARAVFPVAIVCQAGLLLVGAVMLRAQESTTRPAAEPRKEDTESQIDRLVRYAMPGRHHRLYDRMVGEWTTVSRYRMTPEAPEVEANGASTRKWVLGKRFVMEEFEGGNLGLPFNAVGLYGYDAFEGKYTSMWADSMSTAITTYQGVYDPDKDVVNFTGTYGNPWTGRKAKCRGATRFISDDEHVLELYVPDAAGNMFRTLAITYTRKPAPADKPAPAASDPASK